VWALGALALAYLRAGRRWVLAVWLLARVLPRPLSKAVWLDLLALLTPLAQPAAQCRTSAIAPMTLSGVARLLMEWTRVRETSIQDTHGVSKKWMFIASACIC
jgi:endonuclease/exonuclease/phosphatase (EEP) superfamily protein YafD